ncbi:MAG: AtpZ/AtpI family protein [Lachnospiraceae bacterium]
MKYHKNVYEAFVMLMQFGLNMIVPIFILTMAGVYIGNKFNMKYIVVPLFLIGAAAGFRNIYIMAKRIFAQPSERDIISKDNSRDTEEMNSRTADPEEKDDEDVQ